MIVGIFFADGLVVDIYGLKSTDIFWGLTAI